MSAEMQPIYNFPRIIKLITLQLSVMRLVNFSPWTIGIQVFSVIETVSVVKTHNGKHNCGGTSNFAKHRRNLLLNLLQDSVKLGVWSLESTVSTIRIMFDYKLAN
jgi:hypothetical protein